jgi:Uma2 family endonuclease
MAPTRQATFTYQDFLRFPDDGKRHELIEGEHYVTPAPKTKHQQISGALFAAFYNFVHQRRIGTVLAAPCDVVFSNIDVVEPDLLYISAEKASMITETNIKGPPDVVVEILSEGTRKTDEVTKRKLYERYGVREYWIVDPELETVKLYTLEKDRYVKIAELSKEANDRLTSPLLPGLQIPLTDTFE